MRPSTGATARALPFRLYVISDRARMGSDPAAAVVALASAGLRAFQWREKDLTPAASFEAIARIRSLLAGGSRSHEAPLPGVAPPVAPPPVAPSPEAPAPGTPSPEAPPPGAPPAHSAALRLFVNDRADLALSLGCDLHLTETSIPTAAARRILPAGTLIGRSTHDIAGASRAAAEGADFVTFGPVFDTHSKRLYGPPVGMNALREACRATPVPVVALGGIDLPRVAACLDAGAAAVALISAVWDAPEPIRALQDLLSAVGETQGA